VYTCNAVVAVVEIYIDLKRISTYQSLRLIVPVKRISSTAQWRLWVMVQACSCVLA